MIWLAVSVAGAALDAGAAVKALRALKGAAVAFEATDEGVDAFKAAVKAAERKQELTFEIARAAEKAADARRGYRAASKELSAALSKAYSFPGPLTDPDVYKAVLKMAREAIKTGAYSAQRFIKELRKTKLDKVGKDLEPEELAKVKEAWAEAAKLEARAAKGATSIDAASEVSWKGFTKGKRLEHFEKHGAEFGARSSTEYFDQALQFAAKSDATHTRIVGNTIFKYDKVSNTLFIGNRAGRHIKTFYKPTNGIAGYYEAIRKHVAVLRNLRK